MQGAQSPRRGGGVGAEGSCVHFARPHPSLGGPTTSPQHSEVTLPPGVVCVYVNTLPPCASSPSGASIVPPVGAVLPAAAGAAERGRGNPTPTRVPSPATSQHRLSPHAPAPRTLRAFGAARTRGSAARQLLGRGKEKKTPPTQPREVGGGRERKRERMTDCNPP